MVMSGHVPPAPEWRLKKRLVLKQSEVVKKKARSPSYVNTQVRDPGYKKIKAICARLRDSVDIDNGDVSVMKFCSEMDSFVAYAGLQLLDRMKNTKKLAELVLQELKTTERCLDTTITTVDADYIFKMFPKASKEVHYSKYEEAMKRVAIKEEHKMRAARQAEEADMASREETRVAWDDDFDSDRFYGSTGGAGHGHGGPGM